MRMTAVLTWEGTIWTLICLSAVKPALDHPYMLTPHFDCRADDTGPDMGGNDMDIDVPLPADGPALEHADTPAVVAPPSSMTKSADGAPAVLPGFELEFDVEEQEQPQTARCV